MHVITIGESLVAAIHTSHATDRGVNHLITRLPSHMGATWINHGWNRNHHGTDHHPEVLPPQGVDEAGTLRFCDSREPSTSRMCPTSNLKETKNRPVQSQDDPLRRPNRPWWQIFLNWRWKRGRQTLTDVSRTRWSAAWIATTRTPRSMSRMDAPSTAWSTSTWPNTSAKCCAPSSRSHTKSTTGQWRGSHSPRITERRWGSRSDCTLTGTAVCDILGPIVRSSDDLTNLMYGKCDP